MATELQTTAAGEELAGLSRLGFRGTPIPRHRAVTWLDRPYARLLHSTLAAVLITLALVIMAPVIAGFWSDILQFWLERCIPAAQFIKGQPGPLLAPLVEVRIGAGAPTWTQWLNVTAVTSVILLSTLILPRRLLPITYLIRFVTLVQLSACFFFLLLPAVYPYASGAHVTTMLRAGWLSMLAMPWLLALCFYPLEHTWPRKLLFTAIALGFMLLVTPLMAAWHGVVMHHGSLLMHPLLYLVFGPPAFVFWFICLYGWGVSWTDRRTERGT